jgi:predicted outer membrane repeat protein
MRGLFALVVGCVGALAGGCGNGGGGGGSPPVVLVTTLDDAGAGSLRSAVAAAPAGAIVRFEDGLAGTIFLTTGEIGFARDVEIDGPGAAVVTVSGSDASRIFFVPDGVEAVVRGLLLREGAGSHGGAIRSEGSLVLDRVVIDDCHADRAGGVASLGSLVVTDCTVRGCSGFNGGGIAVETGTARIESSTFEANLADGNSAGGLLVQEDAVATLLNCTFTGNSATGLDRVGGAIGLFAESASPELRMSLCTLSGNTATGSGGGIYAGFLTILRIRNCVVAGNTAPAGPDLFAGPGADVQSVGHNVVGDGTDSGLVNGVGGDQVGSALTPLDPMLGPFADHGGPTATFSLLVGSPAIDAVPDAACDDADGDPVDVDQRGEPRPSGADCDAGAFEL